MTTTLRDFDGGLDADGDWADDVVAHSRSGYLIRRGGDGDRLTLLRCPACGMPFNSGNRRKLNDPLADHLHEVHAPADFGLSERGER